MGLVPIQVTSLQYFTLGGVRLDLCLIASFLVGFLAGELDGIMMGLALGYVQDLFSSGEVGFNLMTKGLIGLMAGLMGRHLANITNLAVLALLLGASLLSGLVYLIWGWSGGGLADALAFVQSILLPQAVYDAALGAGVYWVISSRQVAGRDFDDGPLSFGR